MPKTWEFTLNDALRLENILEQIWEDVFDGEFPDGENIADITNMTPTQIFDFAQTLVENQAAWPEKYIGLRTRLEDFLGYHAVWEDE